MIGQSWHYTGTRALYRYPPAHHHHLFRNRCCLEGFTRSLHELCINHKQSSTEICNFTSVSPAHSKMKRFQHCSAPLALCKYYTFPLDMLVSITSTSWLHYFWNPQLCLWLHWVLDLVLQIILSVFHSLFSHHSSSFTRAFFSFASSPPHFPFTMTLSLPFIHCLSSFIASVSHSFL